MEQTAKTFFSSDLWMTQMPSFLASAAAKANSVLILVQNPCAMVRQIGVNVAPRVLFEFGVGYRCHFHLLRSRCKCRRRGRQLEFVEGFTWFDIAVHWVIVVLYASLDNFVSTRIFDEFTFTNEKRVCCCMSVCRRHKRDTC